MRPVSVYDTSQPAGNACSFLTVGIGTTGAAVLFKLVVVVFFASTLWVTLVFVTDVAVVVVVCGTEFWFVC